MFDRLQNGQITAGKDFSLKEHRTVAQKILRDNASLVATLAQLDHKPSLLLRQSADAILSNIFIEKHTVDEVAMLRYYQNNPKLLEAVNRDLARIDLGIRSMEIETTNNGLLASFEHSGLAKRVPIVLVKEEIHFCEKDAEGATSVYGLADIRDIRRSENFYRKYMGGTYGAVPNLG